MSVEWLECSVCGARNNLDKQQWLCNWCGGKLVEKSSTNINKRGYIEHRIDKWPITSKDELERKIGRWRQEPPKVGPIMPQFIRCKKCGVFVEDKDVITHVCE